MSELTTASLGQACRLFMDLAYPGGPTTIPSKKRAYYDIPPDAPLENYLFQGSAACGLCENLTGRHESTQRGYAFRLGSTHFPHLKLHVHQVDYRGSYLWVFSVDTHDAFSRANYTPPDDHPDAIAWRKLQTKNAELKAQIEEVLENAGYLSFKTLLRMGLPSTSTV